MSSASDPLDLAFPGETASAPMSGDPIDVAFHEEKHVSPEVTEGPLGFINGLSEIAGKTIANIPYGAAHGAVDLYRRATGGNPAAPDSSVVNALHFPLSENAKNVGSAVGSVIPNRLPGDEGATAEEAANFGKGRTIKALKAVMPVVKDIAAIAPVAAPFAGRIAGRLGPGADVGTAEEIINRSGAQQSMGAAAANPNIRAISPGLQQAVVSAARKTGGAVNPDVMRAHIEAEEHGLVGDAGLMKGQATRDAGQFTAEQNSTHPDIVARINAQETALVNGLDTIRRDASPSHVANSARENGQVALNDLKAYDKPKVEAISAAYDDANAANLAAGKGALKLDPKPGVDHAVQALEDREDLLPSEGQSILSKMKAAQDTGQGIPLKQAETWKTIVARASRKYERAGDTNAVTALSDFRDSLEQMSPAGDATAAVQQKFNAARSLAKQRFDEIDADPAYKAAVNDTAEERSPLADTFLDDYALSRGAPKSQIDLMMGKLSDEGKEAVASHALSAIRKSAVTANGKITPSGFNGVLEKYQDKLGSLVQPETRDSLESFGRVLTNAKVEPPGGKVNYSRSGIVARDAMQSAAEGIANVKTHGLYGIAKKMLPQDNAFARDALAPGAGLDQLKTKP